MCGVLCVCEGLRGEEKRRERSRKSKTDLKRSKVEKRGLGRKNNRK